MRIVLDTHVFLWYISADAQLPVAFCEAIRDPTNEVYLPRGREAHRIAVLPVEE
jgi:PIN domain nuclease of toxin-antitoxin system